MYEIVSIEKPTKGWKMQGKWRTKMGAHFNLWILRNVFGHYGYYEIRRIGDKTTGQENTE